MWATIILIVKRYKLKSEIKKQEKKRNIHKQLEKETESKQVKKLKLRLKWLDMGIIATIVIPIIACIIAFMLIFYGIMLIGNLASNQVLFNGKDTSSTEEEDDKGWEWETPPNVTIPMCPCGCISSSGSDWDYSTGNLTNEGIHKEIIELSVKIYNETGKVGVPYLPFFIPVIEGGVNFADLTSPYLADLKSAGSIYTGKCYTALGWSDKHGGPSKGGGGFGLDYPSGYLAAIPQKYITDLKIVNYDPKIVSGGFTNSDLTFFLPNWLQGTAGTLANVSVKNKEALLKYIEDTAKFNSLSDEAKSLVYTILYHVNNYHKAGFFYSPGKGLKPLVAMTENGKSNVALDWYCDLAKAIVDDGKRDAVYKVFNAYGFSNKKYVEIARDMDDVLGTGTKYYDGIRAYKANATIVEKTMGFGVLQSDWLAPFKGLYRGEDNFNKCIELAGGSITAGKPGGSTGGSTGGNTGTSENGVCRCTPDLGCCSCNNGGNGALPDGAISETLGIPQSSALRDRDYMMEQINKIKHSTIRNQMLALAPFVGKAPVQKSVIKVDRNMRADGIGYIQYHQSYVEPWGALRCSGVTSGNDFVDASCGSHAASSVLSTYLHRYINPAEVAIMLRTYNVRNGTNISTITNNGITIYTAIKALFVEAGLVAETTNASTSGNLDWDLADKYLEKGGMVVTVVHGKSNGYISYFTTGGHYIVIRDKIGDNQYLVSHSTSVTDITGRTWKGPNEIITRKMIDQNNDANQSVYVLPPGVNW